MGKDGGGMTTLTEAALAVQKAWAAETRENWDCSSYHPALWPAMRNLSAALAASEVQAEPVVPFGWVSKHTTPGMYEWQFNKELAAVYRDTALFITPVYEHPPAPEQPAPADPESPCDIATIKGALMNNVPLNVYQRSALYELVTRAEQSAPAERGEQPAQATIGEQFIAVVAGIWRDHPDYGIRQVLDELCRRFPAPIPPAHARRHRSSLRQRA